MIPYFRFLIGGFAERLQRFCGFILETFAIVEALTEGELSGGIAFLGEVAELREERVCRCG